MFEGRFITAPEAQELGFVNRIYPAADLARETLAYAERVAGRGTVTPRMTKFMVNNALDMMGYSPSIEASYQTYAFGGFPEAAPTMRRGADERRQLQPVAHALELLKNGVPPNGGGVSNPVA